MTEKELLVEWNKTPNKLRIAVRGLSEDDLNLRGGSEGWSIRETVHHIVEANLIASNMIIAALATDGYDYDWTWVNPNASWMHRMSYDKADVSVAISALRGLCHYLQVLITVNPEALSRKIKVNDAPGAARYVLTVDNILRQEVDHADEHLADIRVIRKQHSL